MTRRQALLLPLSVRAFGQLQETNAASTMPERQVHWKPGPAFNGGPILFRSKSYSGPATWMGKEIEFRPDAEGFSALAGVNLNTKPGRYPLHFGGETLEVPVVSHPYRSATITVPPKFVTPPKAMMEQIAEEAALKKQIFHASPQERLWKGAFTAPATTRYTSSFGVRRVYNGKTNSVHQGLDYSAAMGTPVMASNAGRVVIARDMYYEGGFIVIDHGESIFTLYMHQSEFLVKEGAMVEKGVPVGKSGASGRVTGPHLHFGVQWQGVYVEPSTLLGLWS